MRFLVLFCAMYAVLVTSGKSKPNKDKDNGMKIDVCTVEFLNSFICSEVIFESDANYQRISQNQYASTSFPENISPSIILLADPKCNNDIKTILKYANECEYSVVMRSGGHQFSALSSCTDQCIQIDLSKYINTEIIITKNQFNDISYFKYKNIIKAGVGVELKDLYTFLDSNGLFVAGGAATTLGIGGHFQTGGIGYLLRSHGAFTDNVIGFDMILADGTSKLITAKNNYKDLFYAVRGGGPGSFGVITNLYLKTYSNSDYPNNAMGVQALWEYTDENARALAKQWLIFQSDINYIEYDDFFPLFAIAPDLNKGGHVIVIAFIWIDDVNGRSYSDFGKSYFMQPFLDATVNKPVLFIEIPDTVSTILNSFLNDSPEITPPIPYVLRANGVRQVWDERFIDILIDNVTSIVQHSDTNGNVFVNLAFETYGGMFLKNDPNKQLSALPFRDLSMLLAVQLFYTDTDGRTYAEDYLDTTFNQYMQLDSWNNEDIREWGYTFGDLDMEIEKQNLNYFIDQKVYDKITQIKQDVDECNIFNNKFTVPLPDINQNEIIDLNIFDLDSKNMLLIKQWTNRFYYELDQFTSISQNNGDWSDLTEFITDNTIPDVQVIVIGDTTGKWNGRREFIGLLCGSFGPFINEDHFQTTSTFLSYQREVNNCNNKCKFDNKEIVKLSSKALIYSIVTFENNIRATFINRNEFTFLKYKTKKNNWLLSKWIVDVERVDINNLG